MLPTNIIEPILLSQCLIKNLLVVYCLNGHKNHTTTCKSWNLITNACSLGHVVNNFHKINWIIFEVYSNNVNWTFFTNVSLMLVIKKSSQLCQFCRFNYKRGHGINDERVTIKSISLCQSPLTRRYFLSEIFNEILKSYLWSDWLDEFRLHSYQASLTTFCQGISYAVVL